MALSIESTWACTTCTYVNVTSSSQCAVCSTARNNNHNPYGTDWECNSCKTQNSWSCNKCAVCYTAKGAVFSQNDINDINRFVSNSSQSAPNPPIQSDKFSKKKTEIFDIYTNHKKKALLPIDIQINSSMKPKLGPPLIRIHYDDDFNLSTSPSPAPSLSSISSNNLNEFYHNNPLPLPPPLDLNTPKLKKANFNLNNLGLMNKMVRKYSDPTNDSITTTLLITPTTKKKHEYKHSIQSLSQNIHNMDDKIMQILQKRHANDAYYKYITHNTATAIDSELINAPSQHTDSRPYAILKCVCGSNMVHTKCAVNEIHLKCYKCGVFVSKLGMEYYHCPNIQLSQHENVGRDLCCICAVKMMLNQDKNVNIKRNSKAILTAEEQLVLHDNYLKYQTYKFESMVPCVLMLQNVADFEYIYQGIRSQTLSFAEYSGIAGVLDAESMRLETEMDAMAMDIFKSKSNKNDIKNECWTISNDLNRVSAEITKLMKKINLLSKKKQDLQCKMQSILKVLSTINSHENKLEMVSNKTYLYREKIERRIKCVEEYNNKMNELESVLNEKKKVLVIPKEYQIWNTKQCVMALEQYVLNNKIVIELEGIVAELHNNKITGKDLRNLNELTFKMMNIKDSYHQKILLLWINYVIQSQECVEKPEKAPIVNWNDEDCKMEARHNNLLCAVCMVNNVNVILNPCGHICICDSCSIKIKQICPVCRIQIKQIKHCFFASR